MPAARAWKGARSREFFIHAAPISATSGTCLPGYATPRLRLNCGPPSRWPARGDAPVVPRVAYPVAVRAESMNTSQFSGISSSDFPCRNLRGCLSCPPSPKKGEATRKLVGTAAGFARSHPPLAYDRRAAAHPSAPLRYARWRVRRRSRHICRGGFVKRSSQTARLPARRRGAAPVKRQSGGAGTAAHQIKARNGCCGCTTGWLGVAALGLRPFHGRATAPRRRVIGPLCAPGRGEELTHRDGRRSR